MQGFAKVRLGKADYLIPYDAFGLRLIRITNHPLNPRKLLVWRHEREPPHWGEKALRRRSILVSEASKSRDMIIEGREIANLVYDLWGKEKATVWDFKVEPRFRKKTIGTAMRETMLADLKKSGVDEAMFPAEHEEEKFYLQRGFKKMRIPMEGYPEMGYVGKISKIGVRPGTIKKAFRILWQRPRPRVA